MDNARHVVRYVVHWNNTAVDQRGPQRLQAVRQTYRVWRETPGNNPRSLTELMVPNASSENYSDSSKSKNHLKSHCWSSRNLCKFQAIRRCIYALCTMYWLSMLCWYIMPCPICVPDTCLRVATNIIAIHVAKSIELCFVLFSPSSGQSDFVRVEK